MIADLLGIVVLLLLVGMFVLFMAPVALFFYSLNKKLFAEQRQPKDEK